MISQFRQEQTRWAALPEQLPIGNNFWNLFKEDGYLALAMK